MRMQCRPICLGRWTYPRPPEASDEETAEEDQVDTKVDRSRGGHSALRRHVGLEPALKCSLPGKLHSTPRGEISRGCSGACVKEVPCWEDLKACR